MFNNIGSTIKTLARIVLWTGIAGSVIWGFVLLSNEILLGPLFMVVGGFASMLVASLIYGFGQLVENSDILAESCKSKESSLHIEPTKSYPVPTKTPSETNQPWTCINCGASNCPQVKSCRNCGVTRSWSHFKNEQE